MISKEIWNLDFQIAVYLRISKIFNARRIFWHLNVGGWFYRSVSSQHISFGGCWFASPSLVCFFFPLYVYVRYKVSVVSSLFLESLKTLEKPMLSERNKWHEMGKFRDVMPEKYHKLTFTRINKAWQFIPFESLYFSISANRWPNWSLIQ